MLETLLMALAGIGLLAVFIGRHIMIRDTGGDLPFLWMIALRMIPFSDLVYMVRHFAQARKGGLLAIAGMWLMVPYAGTKLWEEQTQFKKHAEKWKGEFAKHMEKRREEGLSGKLAQMSGEQASACVKYDSHKLAEKEKIVNQLNARLAWWHQQLQGRRASLDPKDAAAVQEFNADAAAYASLNEIAKEKSQELLTLRSNANR
ncbi:MAG: hypothetical protein ABIP20_16345 [Chthoniobacteraceae bacterium]